MKLLHSPRRSDGGRLAWHMVNRSGYAQPVPEGTAHMAVLTYLTLNTARPCALAGSCRFV